MSKRQQTYPNIWTPQEISISVDMCSAEIETPEGKKWVPGRAQKRKTLGFWHCFKAAWMVFTGRWDVVKWEGQE